MRLLCILAVSCALAQPPAAPNPQRAAGARQRETSRRQAQSVGAMLLPSIEAESAHANSMEPPVEPACDALPDEETTPLIEAAAKTQSLQPELIRAVIWRESAFRPCATSVKGAEGLMQLMPAVATEFGVTNSFDPRQNIEAGAKFLKQLLEKYKGDVRLALAAYNAGTAAVDTAGGIPAFGETQEYVKAITAKLAAK